MMVLVVRFWHDGRSQGKRLSGADRTGRDMPLTSARQASRRRMHRRAAHLATAAAILAALGISPASANDSGIGINANDELRAAADWDDSSNKLCAQLFAGAAPQYALAEIRPVADGPGPSVQVKDFAAAFAPTCKSGLNVPENALYYLRVRWLRADGTFKSSPWKAFET